MKTYGIFSKKNNKLFIFQDENGKQTKAVFSSLEWGKLLETFHRMNENKLYYIKELQ